MMVSGVGGQFNFVEQAFALEGGRSVITLPAWRMSGGTPCSNIRWTLDTVTVPRHMRDVVVTEYGAADLRGLSDAQVIAALLNITDSRFQSKLMEQAKTAGKLPDNHEIPEAHRENYPQRVRAWIEGHRAALPTFPFGSDFDDIERVLLPALAELKELSSTWRGKAQLLVASLWLPPHEQELQAMSRMGFKTNEGLTARALQGALRRTVR